ncbi:MAG: hypothetical protein ACPLX8_02395 [Nanopusillaceae archaeon]
MDWKKVVLLSVFSVIILALFQIYMAAVVVSILVYSLIEEIEDCKIANIGIVILLTSLLLYAVALISGLYNLYELGRSAQSLIVASGYLQIIGTVLTLLGVLIQTVLKKKLSKIIFN